MKIVFVENPRPLTLEHYNDVANAPLSASLNSGYALAIARLAGWDNAYLDFTSHSGSADQMADAILAEDGDLILFHWVYSWGHEQIVRDTLSLLRKECVSPIGAFGLFPTLARQQLFQYVVDLDFIFFGEFEDTLDELLRTFRETQAIPALAGIAFPDGTFKARPLINHLSHLPIPDDVGANCSYSSMNIAASRGCYGECSFCFIHRYYGCSRRRTRPLASIEQELDVRLARRSINSLYFVDPSFIGLGNQERERVTAISRMARERNLPFGCETRVDSITPELLDILARNGASSIFLGIESGCDSVLKRIGKRTTKQQAIQAVRAVQRSGIQLTVGFIMFEPDSTLAEIQENYEFLEQLGLLTHHDLTANLLYHNQIVLRGSAAWERFERDGRLLLDPLLPFEARYRFLDERVGLVCAAMGQLSSAYFTRMDRYRKSGPGNSTAVCCNHSVENINDDALNMLLKDAFRDFCSASATLRPLTFKELVDRYLHQLQSVFQPM
jgi:radical SAM superfamily enzyme YgiQ (UPF0313 family)